MPPNSIEQLEEELNHLKELIQTHFDYKDIIWENKSAEFEEYINSMLDYYVKLRQDLNALKNKKENNGNS